MIIPPYSVLKKHLNDNIERLQPIIINAYNIKYPNKKIHLVGSGVFLGQFKQQKGIENYVSFAYSIANLKKLFNHYNSTIEIKSTMSNKVDFIVWSGHSYHNPGHFDKYNKPIIDWIPFLQPLIDILIDDYLNSKKL